MTSIRKIRRRAVERYNHKAAWRRDVRRRALRSMIRDAEHAARSAGASLWYVPPERYGRRPQLVPAPADLSGLRFDGCVSWLEDRAR